MSSQIIDEDVAIKAIEQFLDKYPLAEWGPAHIVLSDYNLDRESISNYVG